ncbi:MAG: tRNA (guanosine(37)-N1)-methyltransferase TrmD [Bdellovibrionaceae bacterium]|nr:tRNA (guanosine(37)-N1)-methyltransferase TrmD [Bdellovibrionales bacterium]MCB9083697.1 tRNA (guanosine(37)-N1)-methyltransferase TrmD [Pseudobdellovibrionaceae bacterium]
MGKRQFNVITIFPDMIRGALKEGLVGQAFHSGKVVLDVVNPRSFTQDVHQSVDDRPFGGGDGMVFLAEPLRQAVESLGEKRGRVVYLSPQGRVWSDSLAREWAQSSEPITLVCGRYGGVDQRFIETLVDEEISIGDYVLSGGELGALVLIDSVVRLLPEVLGNADSPDKESFAEGLLECPLFSRPREFGELPVPEALLSGHHGRIEEFRQDVAWVQTQLFRPDLLAGRGEAAGKLLQALPRLLNLSEKELKSLGLERTQLADLLEHLENQNP